MKFQNFNDLDGETDQQKSENLVMSARNGVYVQIKYNGVNCRISKNSAGGLCFATKNDKHWHPHFFGEALYQRMLWILDRVDPRLTFNAELVAIEPGVKLATLAGWVNVNSVYCHEPNKVGFIINDMYHREVAYPFSERTNRLREIFQGKEDNYIKLAKTDVLFTPEGLEWYYESHVANGEEGIMIRVDPCYYYEGKSITPHGWKRPKYFTAEGRITNAIEGDGKRKGMLGAFMVCINSEFVWVGGGKNLTDEILTDYWVNRAKYIGQMATIRYAELSVNDVPLRPQLVAIRNYE